MDRLAWSAILTAARMRMLVACAALFAGQALAGEVRTVPPRAVTGAPSPNRLSNADQQRFDRIMVEHRTTRGRLTRPEQADLDHLCASTRDVLFAKGTPNAGTWTDVRAAMVRAMRGLSDAEAGTLAAYCVDGIAAGDLGIVLYAPADTSQNIQQMQMSFNLQYLQLQSQMQNENRSYTAVSNIMKTKHDTVKNSISNVR